MSLRIALPHVFIGQHDKQSFLQSFNPVDRINPLARPVVRTISGLNPSFAALGSLLEFHVQWSRSGKQLEGRVSCQLGRRPWILVTSRRQRGSNQRRTDIEAVGMFMLEWSCLSLCLKNSLHIRVCVRFSAEMFGLLGFVRMKDLNGSWTGRLKPMQARQVGHGNTTGGQASPL